MTIPNLNVLVSFMLEIKSRIFNRWETVKKKDSDFPCFIKYILLVISCRKSNLEHGRECNTFQSIPRPCMTYTLGNGSQRTYLKISKLKLKIHIFLVQIVLPARAHCTTSFKSNSNFYGYETKKQKLKFLQCQRDFCCTGN